MGDPFLSLAKIKNAFPGTLARKGVLCVTETVELKVKLGVFWLGLAWLGLARKGSTIHLPPQFLFELPEIL